MVELIVGGGGQADCVAADLDGSPSASGDLAIEATQMLGGHIDILVNNAGVFPRTTTATTDEDGSTPFLPVSFAHPTPMVPTVDLTRPR